MNYEIEFPTFSETWKRLKLAFIYYYGS